MKELIKKYQLEFLETAIKENDGDGIRAVIDPLLLSINKTPSAVESKEEKKESADKNELAYSYGRIFTAILLLKDYPEIANNLLELFLEGPSEPIKKILSDLEEDEVKLLIDQIKDLDLLFNLADVLTQIDFAREALMAFSKIEKGVSDKQSAAYYYSQIGMAHCSLTVINNDAGIKSLRNFLSQVPKDCKITLKQDNKDALAKRIELLIQNHLQKISGTPEQIILCRVLKNLYLPDSLVSRAQALALIMFFSAKEEDADMEFYDIVMRLDHPDNIKSIINSLISFSIHILAQENNFNNFNKLITILFPTLLKLLKKTDSPSCNRLIQQFIEQLKNTLARPMSASKKSMIVTGVKRFYSYILEHHDNSSIPLSNIIFTLMQNYIEIEDIDASCRLLTFVTQISDKLTFPKKEIILSEAYKKLIILLINFPEQAISQLENFLGRIQRYYQQQDEETCSEIALNFNYTFQKMKCSNIDIHIMAYWKGRVCFLYETIINSKKCHDLQKIPLLVEILENNHPTRLQSNYINLLATIFQELNLDRPFNIPQECEKFLKFFFAKDEVISAKLNYLFYPNRKNLPKIEVFKNLILELNEEKYTKDDQRKGHLYVDFLIKEKKSNKKSKCDHESFLQAASKLTKLQLISESAYLTEMVFSQALPQSELKASAFIFQLFNFSWPEARKSESDINQFVESVKKTFPSLFKNLSGIENVGETILNLIGEYWDRKYYLTVAYLAQFTLEHIKIDEKKIVLLHFYIICSLFESNKIQPDLKHVEKAKISLDEIIKMIKDKGNRLDEPLPTYLRIILNSPNSLSKEIAEFSIHLLKYLNKTEKVRLLDTLIQSYPEHWRLVKNFIENLNEIDFQKRGENDEEYTAFIHELSNLANNIKKINFEKNDSAKEVLLKIIFIWERKLNLYIIDDQDKCKQLRKKLIIDHRTILKPQSALTFFGSYEMASRSGNDIVETCLPSHLRMQIFSFLYPIRQDLMESHINSLSRIKSREIYGITRKCVEIIRQHQTTKEIKLESVENDLNECYIKLLLEQIGEAFPEKMFRLFLYQETREGCRKWQKRKDPFPYEDEIARTIRNALEKANHLKNSLLVIMQHVCKKTALLQKDQVNFYLSLGNLIAAYYPNFPFNFLPTYLVEPVAKLLTTKQPMESKRMVIPKKTLFTDNRPIQIKSSSSEGKPIEITESQLLSLLKAALPEPDQLNPAKRLRGRADSAKPQEENGLGLKPG